MGVDSVGSPDGAGEVIEAFLIVNVTITGAGTNTVNFDVNGFLSQPGERNLGGGHSSVPEPSTAMLVGARV